MQAQEFADHMEQAVEPWMEWGGWYGYVGCENCAEGGPQAPCWGRPSCHGYLHGCGCQGCAERDAEVLEALRLRYGPPEEWDVVALPDADRLLAEVVCVMETTTGLSHES